MFDLHVYLTNNESTVYFIDYSGKMRTKGPFDRILKTLKYIFRIYYDYNGSTSF